MRDSAGRTIGLVDNGQPCCVMFRGPGPPYPAEQHAVKRWSRRRVEHGHEDVCAEQGSREDQVLRRRVVSGHGGVGGRLPR